MEVLKEKYPKALEWIQSLDPFIVIRGEKNVIIKFSDGRPSLVLSYDSIQDYENNSTGPGLTTCIY